MTKAEKITNVGKIAKMAADFVCYVGDLNECAYTDRMLEKIRDLAVAVCDATETCAPLKQKENV